MSNDIFSRDFHLMLSDTDRFRRLRLSVLFRMFQDLSVLHAEQIGAGRELTLDRGFLWIVSKVSLEFSRIPVYGEDITLKTWPGSMSHVLFPRFYQLEGRCGEVLAHASSLWALIDGKKRTVVIPKNHGISVRGLSVGGELPLPGPIHCPEADTLSRRTVLYSETDMNGHMNNSRYLDWADDCLDSSVHKEMTLKKLQINFMSEAVQGMPVLLESSFKNGLYSLKGVSDMDKGKTVFVLNSLYS
jgi:acyl-ACP thioesterase